MRPAVTKFLIKSRIPDAQLIILAIVYLISGLILLEFDTLSLRIGKVVPFDYRILIVTVFTVIEFDIFQLFSRNAFVKSDLDFLANYGARASTLSKAFSIYSLMFMSLPSFLIFSTISFFSTASVPTYATALFFLSILASSVLGFLLQIFGQIRDTNILLILVAGLGILGLVGFPPAISNISGNNWQFSLIGAFAILAVALAMTWSSILNRDDAVLHFRNVMVRNNVKHPINFSGWSRQNPLLKFSATMTFPATRVNPLSGKKGLGRVTMAGMMLVSSVIFILLILLTFYFPSIGSGISLVVILYYMFLMSFLLFYSIINERIWIGWNTLEPHVAVRNYVSGRLILLAIVSSPVFAYLIYAYFSSLSALPFESFTISILVPLLLFFPFFVYATIINLNVIKVQSRTFGGSLSEGTFIIFLPLVIAYVILSLTGVFLIHFGIATVIFSYGLMGLLLLSRRVMEKSFFNLVKHGFT